MKTECGHDFAAQMEAIDDGGCPLCLKDAAANLERRYTSLAEDHHDTCRHVERLEEEKAQLEASLREAKDEIYQATTVAYDERLRCQSAESRLAQAEAREAALREALEGLSEELIAGAYALYQQKAILRQDRDWLLNKANKARATGATP